MNNYVMTFFRRGPALPDADRQRLNAATAAWAKSHEAHGLDPRILGPESSLCGAWESADAAGPFVLSALMFFQAADQAEAAAVAESHPGLKHGFCAIVRSWSKPAGTTSR